MGEGLAGNKQGTGKDMRGKNTRGRMKSSREAPCAKSNTAIS